MTKHNKIEFSPSLNPSDLQQKQNRLKTKTIDISRIPECPVTSQNIQKPIFLQKSQIFKIAKNRATSPFLTWLGGWDTDTHKHSAVASRQNFQTTQKTQKIKKTQNQLKTPKIEISRIPECPVASQNTQKIIYCQKSEIDFASRVPPRQPEAQFLIQNSICDYFQNFGFLSKKWFLGILGGHWTLGDSGNFNFFGF